MAIWSPHEVVLIDPPWWYPPENGHTNQAARHYPLMPDDDVLCLPVWEALAKRSILFIWATCPRLDFALQCLSAWGLHYRGVAFVWVKTKADGRPWGARGVRPSIVKPTTELVLAASPLKKGRPLPLSDESIVQTVFAPTTKHSEKPLEVMERIERMYPTASKQIIFARRTRPGWDAWGERGLRCRVCGAIDGPVWVDLPEILCVACAAWSWLWLTRRYKLADFGVRVLCLPLDPEPRWRPMIPNLLSRGPQ